MTKHTICAIQLNSDDNINDNLKLLNQLLYSAKDQGAELVVLPEMFASMTPKKTLLNLKEEYGQGPIQNELMALAKKYQLWIIGGTIPIAAPASERYHAACLAISPDGNIEACYNKIHLFDIKLNKNEYYNESETTLAGTEVVTIDTPLGKVGLAVCYDLRFPELFRCLMQSGAEIIALPAAFTKTTGQYHWEVLLRARAIENSCYVIAANQVGQHPNGYNSYGHSMIVNPWGEVVASQASGSAAICAQIDADHVRTTRQTTPFTSHRRIFYDKVTEI
jgi:deaminated glutathione amidase